MHIANIQVGLSIELFVLTTCAFMFRQVCTIGPSFFNAVSGKHRRPFEGRHELILCLPMT